MGGGGHGLQAGYVCFLKYSNIDINFILRFKVK